MLRCLIGVLRYHALDMYMYMYYGTMFVNREGISKLFLPGKAKKKKKKKKENVWQISAL